MGSDSIVNMDHFNLTVNKERVEKRRALTGKIHGTSGRSDETHAILIGERGIK